MARVLFLTKTLKALLLALVVTLLVFQIARSAIITTGDVDPATDPSTWGFAIPVSIGGSSSGALSITDGSSLEHSNSTVTIGEYGLATTDGEGSEWRHSTLNIYGRVSITNGGYVYSHTGIHWIGRGLTNNATVAVDGTGSSWLARGSIWMGNSGSQGSINISNGGSVSTASAYIGSGYFGNGLVSVDGDGSSFTVSSQSYLGNGEYQGGLFAMNITNGGSVDTGSTGFENGTVTVDGEGSSWINGTLRSYGTIKISNRGSMVGSGSNIYNGTLTVDGEGSSWINYYDLRVGISYSHTPGPGILNILNGSTVSITGFTEIGEHGAIAFGNNGGVLTTNSLRFDRDQISGSGIINTSGVVGDLDIVFDDSHGNTQSFTIDGVTLNLSIDSSSEFGVGYRDDGNLTIEDGATVNTNTGLLGYYSSTGVANIKGPGSSWINNEYLAVGNNGTGILSITNSGSVTNTNTYMGRYSDSRGKVFVNGDGSTLASHRLYVGNSGTASLSVTNGGLANATDNLSINSFSTVTIDVGHDSALRSGTADNYHNYGIDNDGTIRLVAGAGVAFDTYTPLLCWGLTGRGIVQALGGQWNNTTLEMTIADAVTAKGNGGASATIDLAANQRVLITDSLVGKSVGAGFFGTDSSNDITFTATTVSNNDLAALEDLLAGTDEQVFSAWDFSVEGYIVSADRPVYLSMLAGSVDCLLDLTIWHLVNGEWSEYDVLDLAFDGTYASFVADNLGGYAVTGTSQPIEYISGDLDGDGIVSLEDAILALQVTSGMEIVEINKEADVDGDGKDGIAEAVYVIQRGAK